MPFEVPVNLDLPIWPLPLVAAVSLLGMCAFFALAIRDLLKSLHKKPAEKKDPDRTG